MTENSGSEGRPNPRKKSSDYNCGFIMKRKDSSSQAPQNDNEERNDGGQPSEITIVSRETSPRKPARCPSSNARLNLRRRPQDLSCACFSRTLAIKPGCRHVPALQICNLQKRAKSMNRFSIQKRAYLLSLRSGRSAPIRKNINPAPHAPPPRTIPNPGERFLTRLPATNHCPPATPIVSFAFRKVKRGKTLCGLPKELAKIRRV